MPKSLLTAQRIRLVLLIPTRKTTVTKHFKKETRNPMSLSRMFTKAALSLGLVAATAATGVAAPTATAAYSTTPPTGDLAQAVVRIGNSAWAVLWLHDFTPLGSHRAPLYCERHLRFQL